MENSLKSVSFEDEIFSFLSENGVAFSLYGGNMILVRQSSLLIVPVSLARASQTGAMSPGFAASCNPSTFPTCSDVLFLYEDIWLSGGQPYRKRLLARCGIFTSLFARKCSVVRLISQKEKEMAREFLNANHSYGWCSSKYCYALMMQGSGIVAVATFSSSLVVERSRGVDLFPSLPAVQPAADTVSFDSYQWLRYASLAGVRVVGGMGRLLKAFIRDVNRMRCAAEDAMRPNGRGVEIMSYSDNEWSNGSVYPRLGFHECGGRGPVEFIVEKGSFRRFHLSKVHEEDVLNTGSGHIRITNMGSRRFLLQLPL